MRLLCSQQNFRSEAPKASKQGNIYGYIWGKTLTSMEFQDVDMSIPPVLFL